MTRGDRGRGRGDRGKGTGRRGWPKKRTGIPLDLGEPAAGTSAPTPVPVVPTPSPAEGGPTIRMIPTPGSSREAEREDITLEEELARQAGRIYLRRDGGNW
ncbi:hypothetical protein PIB30_038241 [Stylosanthes scabra]|uniref:Uncharacterized protein n=1 Tax=Stylosanthes scabra TaxID=79078 RepID=A0ABU6UD93_9FABA|nr:hypothetical protein [Stylosanthes scabra]